MNKIEKIKQVYTTTENGIPSKFEYVIAPTVKEMVNKINELVETVNKLIDTDNIINMN